MEYITRIGVDTSKNVFQLHGVNAVEKPIIRKKLTRAKMVAFFEAVPPTVIAIEACGSAHHWAKHLSSPAIYSRFIGANMNFYRHKSRK